MKLNSIKNHLTPYSIVKKRRTTIAHAFASALAPNDNFDEAAIRDAMAALDQPSTEMLTCVYCGHPAETWDHLTSLVRAGELNGYGHQIGNLVPCCRACNSAKGSLPFEKFVERSDSLMPDQKSALIAKLRNHQLLAKRIDFAKSTEEEVALLARYRRIQDNVLALLQEADQCAEAIREQRRRA